MATVAKNFAARWCNAEPPPWIVEQRRREEGVAKVCRTLHTTKMMICDPLLSLGLGRPSIDPTLLEKWLIKHGKYRDADGESIRDAVVKHYGKDTADLIDSLF